jgi:hypothetical protein
MTQREERQSTDPDIGTPVYLRGLVNGRNLDGSLSVEVFCFENPGLLTFVTASRGMVVERSAWHKFDPSDETTWPKDDKNGVDFWVFTHYGTVVIAPWKGLQLWHPVKAWQEIPIPSPPTAEGQEQ